MLADETLSMLMFREEIAAWILRLRAQAPFAQDDSGRLVAHHQTRHSARKERRDWSRRI